MATVLFPLPDRDFDVTEVAVPWRLLLDAGHDVVFATEAGATPACDPLLITGVVFGKLGARPEPFAFYREMSKSPAFRSPRTWTDIASATPCGSPPAASRRRDRAACLLAAEHRAHG